MKREISLTELRLGVGKHDFKEPTPWYVTCYSRDLSTDNTLGWHATHSDAIKHTTQLLKGNP